MTFNIGTFLDAAAMSCVCQIRLQLITITPSTECNVVIMRLSLTVIYNIFKKSASSWDAVLRKQLGKADKYKKSFSKASPSCGSRGLDEPYSRRKTLLR